MPSKSVLWPARPAGPQAPAVGRARLPDRCGVRASDGRRGAKPHAHPSGSGDGGGRRRAGVRLSGSRPHCHPADLRLPARGAARARPDGERRLPAGGGGRPARVGARRADGRERRPGGGAGHRGNAHHADADHHAVPRLTYRGGGHARAPAHTPPLHCQHARHARARLRPPSADLPAVLPGTPPPLRITLPEGWNALHLEVPFSTFDGQTRSIPCPSTSGRCPAARKATSTCTGASPTW